MNEVTIPKGTASVNRVRDRLSQRSTNSQCSSRVQGSIAWASDPARRLICGTINPTYPVCPILLTTAAVAITAASNRTSGFLSGAEIWEKALSSGMDKRFRRQRIMLNTINNKRP